MASLLNLLVKSRDLSWTYFFWGPLSVILDLDASSLPACLNSIASFSTNDLINLLSASGKNDKDLNRGSRKHALYNTSSTCGSWQQLSRSVLTAFLISFSTRESSEVTCKYLVRSL